MALNADNPTTPRRGRRADAARNAERLLAAARELVDESGSEVALDEVARQAGVGNATLPELTVTDLLAIGSGAALTGTNAAHAQRLVGLRSGVEVDRDSTIR
jgi:hypothetical protein